MSKDTMRQLLGVGDINTIDNWRRKFGHAAEITNRSGKHRGVWLYAPEWLPLYYRSIGAVVPVESSSAASPTTAKERKEHFDALIAEVKYRELVKEFVAATDVERWMYEFSSGLSAVATVAEKACPDVADLLNGFLDSEREKIETRLHGGVNGHQVGPAAVGPDQGSDLRAEPVLSAPVAS